MIAVARNLRRPFAQRRSVSSGRSVRLTYGIHDLCAEIAGLTVAETELAFHDILNLGAEAEAYVNGNRAGRGTSLRSGDRLEWVKTWGCKGSDDEDEFFTMTVKEAAMLFGVHGGTIRKWIYEGVLRGTKRPLRTSMKACREFRDKQMVQPIIPVKPAKPRPFYRNNRQPWEFIDPDKSGTK